VTASDGYTSVNNTQPYKVSESFVSCVVGRGVALRDQSFVSFLGDIGAGVWLPDLAEAGLFTCNNTVDPSTIA
jgi:hypothetical protein